MIIKKHKGFTVSELMVSVAIFSIISIILFVTFSSGQKHLATSTSKLDNERGINIATQDINFSIRNGSLSTIGILSKNDGTGYISIESASTYDTNTHNIINNDLSFNISGTSSSMKWNFVIVYFTAKINNCPKCKELGLNLENKNLCPHKHLIKRYYTLNNTYTGFLKWSNTTNLTLLNLINNNYNNDKYDKILARNVITFIPQSAGRSITYSIKLFKDHNIVKNSITEEKLQKTIEAVKTELANNNELNLTQTATITDDPLTNYTTQINYTVTPLNN